MIKTITNMDEVIDFVWELSQNKLYASYPRKQSMKEIREEVEAAIHSDKEKIIACYQEDRLYGVCIYFWESDDNYIQTKEFLIKENYEQTADEFIDYINRQLPGFELLIGVPLTNEEANEYFSKKNIECIESSIDTRLYNLELYDNQKHEQIEKVTENCFDEYAPFHDRYAIPLNMYYNSTVLRKHISNFHILVFRQDEEIRGSIFIRLFKGGAEVFGLFVDEQYKHRGIESILIHEMLRELYNGSDPVKEIIYFIDENSSDELNSALDAGFEMKDRYRCYRCIMQ